MHINARLGEKAADSVPEGKPENGIAAHELKCEPYQHALLLREVLKDDSTVDMIKKAIELLHNESTQLTHNALQLCKEILADPKISTEAGPVATELVTLLLNPTMKSVLDAHDQLRDRAFYTPPPSPSIEPYKDVHVGEPLKIIGLFKTGNEPLGVTLSADGKGRVFIARINQGSLIDRQGLLHVGDVIREINNVPVKGETPDDICGQLQRLSGSVTLKVTPMYKETFGQCQMFVRTHFDYNPAEDDRLSSTDESVVFSRGEILEIVDQSDLLWWQARATDGSGRGGIVPSSLAEERRRVRITPSHKQAKASLFGNKKKSKPKKVMFSASKNATTFSKLHAPTYEEVALMPPFDRKVLVLTGPPGIGCRTLKNRLLSVDPGRFATTVPYTSRPPRSEEESGRGYFFVDRDEMQRDIELGRYVEWSEFEGHLYGTKLESVRNVMRSGKVCVLDIKPSSLDVVRTVEFMPLAVFISPPKIDAFKSNDVTSSPNSKPQKKLTESEMLSIIQESEELQRLYSHLVDATLVNEDISVTYKNLRETIEEFGSKSQWVPVDWVY